MKHQSKNRKRRRISEYRCGVINAKADIIIRKHQGMSESALRKFAAERHESNDAKQYGLRANYGAKYADYYRGAAMEFGMYSKTGKHIK